MLKFFTFVLFHLFLLITNSWADVCYDIDKKAADKAVEIIKKQKEIYKYCSICPDVEPEKIIAHKVQNKGTVYVNDAYIDVAHVYYKQGNKFINLGVASECIQAGDYNIPAKLDSLPIIHRIEEIYDEQPPKIETNCEKLLQNNKLNQPLLSIFPDDETAQRTIDCFTQKIKKQTTIKQFSSYQQIYNNLEIVFNSILFYKGKPYEQKIAALELLYIFQNYFYAKLTNDESFKISLPYQYKTLPKHWSEHRALEREILKISNIEARRKVLQRAFWAIEDMGTFFYYTGIKDINILKKIEMEFLNFVYNLVMKVKDNEYFMNPNNSTRFFNDCLIWEMMTGKTITDRGTDIVPCPLPFP